MKTASKRGLCVLGLTLAWIAYAPQLSLAQGIPTIDAAAVAEAIENTKAWAEQYQQMAEQYEALKKQYDKLDETLEALKGSRSFKEALAALQKAPTIADVTKIIDDIKKIGFFQLILAEELKKEKCEKISKDRPKAIALCEKKAENSAMLAVISAKVGAIVTRLGEISKEKKNADIPGKKDDVRDEILDMSAELNTYLNAINLLDAYFKTELGRYEKAAQKELLCRQFGNLPKKCKEDDKTQTDTTTEPNGSGSDEEGS
jgi:hypothetical protein